VSRFASRLRELLSALAGIPKILGFKSQDGIAASVVVGCEIIREFFLMQSRASSYSITLLKVFAIAFIFAPMWGLTWHKIDFNEQWAAQWAAEKIGMQIAGGRWDQAAIYALVYGVALAGIFVTPFIKGSLVRISIILVLMTGWFFDHFFLEMNGIFSNRDLLSLLWDEWHLSSDAARAYQGPLLRNLSLAAVIAAVLCIPPRATASLSNYWAAVPGLALMLIAYLGNSTNAALLFPVPYGIVSTSALLTLNVGGNRPFGYFTAQNIDPDRVISAPLQTSHRFKKIIMIMDESVRGDQLSINSDERETTPFLKDEPRLINFGLAVSGGNCSSISRTIFRYGLRQHHLPNQWNEGAKSPLIWQFARNAGYHTIHIDGIAGPLQFHNGFTQKEKALIDADLSVLDDPPYRRDPSIAEKVRSLVASDQMLFLLVDKHGLHFPYEKRHPPVRDDRTMTPIEHYHLGVTWSVDGFFSELAGLNLSDTLLIYTSDHGQNLGGGITHCSVSKDVSSNEASVPLFAETGDRSFEERLRQSAGWGFNKMSHFEIFPTLLIAMGYDEEWVRKFYGPSLLDKSSEVPRSFLVGNPYINPVMISVDRPARRQ
jgi:glucan phosphoethanolaminetransferase (alkaline phosphatase superfamily)